MKWRKKCTGLKFDLVHFNGPQTKYIGDSLYKHPVEDIITLKTLIPAPAPFLAIMKGRKDKERSERPLNLNLNHAVCAVSQLKS